MNDKYEKTNSLKSFISTQIYFTKLIYKEHPKSIIFFIVLTLIVSIVPPVLIIIYKEAIDKIGLLSNDSSLLSLAILLLTAYFFINYISETIENIKEYIFTKISQTLIYIMKKSISKKLISIPFHEFEDSTFFDNINLANRALNENPIKVTGDLINIIGSIISLFGILGILLSIHWSLPLGLFLSTLPGIIIIFVVKIKNYHMHKETSVKERELSLTDSLFFERESIKEMKVYNLGDYLINKWSGLYKYIQNQTLQIALWESKTKSLTGLILQISSLIIAVLLVFQINSGNLTIGSYVALFSAITTVQGIFASIGGNLGSIFESIIYNEALMKILNYKKDKSIGVENSSIEELNEIKEINLSNVSFKYPNSDFRSLNNVTMRIKKGEKISIVGSNGSGKTTLTKCILGLYDLEEGKISVNGSYLSELNLDNYLKRVAVIYQNFYRYRFSIRENVGFGDISKLNNDEEIINILKRVDMFNKITSYKEGIDTYLTKEMPEGTELSGGEWQKIAIARAFLKDSDLIILDEPTAALDPISELEIFKLFYELSENKTTITISHRIGPTRYSDRIIVMDKGKIIEEGTFDQLISKKGLYYDLYNSQASWYYENTSKIRN